MYAGREKSLRSLTHHAGRLVTTLKAPDVPSKGWSQERCGISGMYLCFASLAEASDIRTKAMLHEELDRHLQLSRVDLRVRGKPRITPKRCNCAALPNARQSRGETKLYEASGRSGRGFW